MGIRKTPNTSFSNWNLIFIFQFQKNKTNETARLSISRNELRLAWPILSIKYAYIQTLTHLHISETFQIVFYFVLCNVHYGFYPQKKQFTDFPNYFLHFVWRKLNKPQNGEHWTCCACFCTRWKIECRSRIFCAYIILKMVGFGANILKFEWKICQLTRNEWTMSIEIGTVIN